MLVVFMNSWYRDAYLQNVASHPILSKMSTLTIRLTFFVEYILYLTEYKGKIDAAY